MKNYTGMTALLLASAVVGQDEPTPALALERAVVVEEVEQDLGAAIALYRGVAERAQDAGVRARAWLRLGLALTASGDAKRGREALQLAAAGTGAAATRAQALLRAQDPKGDGALAARIAETIEQMRKSLSAAEDLVWIGEPAVAQLVAAVDAETKHQVFLSHGSYALLRIGGPRVLEWLGRVAQSDSALVREAVVSSFSNSIQDPQIIAKLMPFLVDADPRVRETALNGLWSVVPAQDVIDRAGDDNARVRAQAMQFLTRKWKELNHERGPVVSIERLIPHLEKALENVDSRIGRAALEFLRQRALFETSAGRRFFLRSVTLPASLVAGVPSFDTQDLPPNAHLDEIVAVARKLGSVDFNPNTERRPIKSSNRQQALGQFTQACSTSWRADALPRVLELVSLGYGHLVPFEQFVMQHATTPALVLDALRRLRHFRYPAQLLHLVIERGVPAGALSPLLDWMRAYREGEVRDDDAFNLCCVAVARMGTREAAEYLVELARDPQHYRSVALGLEQGSGPAVADALQEVLVLGGADDGEARNRVFRRLLELGVTGDPERFARAYQLGLQPSQSAFIGDNHTHLSRPTRGLAWLGVRRWCAGTDGKTLASLAAACLALDHADPWVDMKAAVALARNSDDGLAKDAWGAVFRHALLVPPDQKLFGQLVAQHTAPGYVAFLQAGLASAEHTEVILESVRGRLAFYTAPPAIAPALRRLLGSDNQGIVRDAILVLARIEVEGTLDAIVPLLSHRASMVRRTAAREVGRLAPDRATALVAPLIDDPDGDVRYAVCSIATDLLSRDLVPAMLRGLRDPEEKVRKAAKAALEAISFYEQQHARWKRILDSSGLEATNAAEALIRKARAGDKTLRVAAIQSLGTLGVAETLPFLLELMADADAEIAAAATAAVHKINAAATAKK